MKRMFHLRSFAFSLSLILLSGLPTHADNSTLSADETVQRIQARAQTVAHEENAPTYEYQKKTKLEKLDRSSGECVETTVMISKVMQRKRSHNR